MNIRHLVSALAASTFLFATTPALSEELSLDEARAEIERLEQENKSLQDQLDANEVTISEYKEQMAGIEEQIAQLQARTEQ